MADKTIPQLDETCTITPTTLFAVDDGIQSYKAKACSVAACLSTMQRNFVDVIGNACWTPPAGITKVRMTPLPVPFINGAFSSTNGFGLTSNGDLYSWGSAQDGALGDGTITNHCMPAVVSCSAVYCFSQVVTSGEFTAALSMNGAAYAWGAGGCGRLGTGALLNVCVPTAVAGSQRFKKLQVASNGGTLGLTHGGNLYSWGTGFLGVLGTGCCAVTCQCSPVCVPASNLPWVDFWAGQQTVYAMRSACCMFAWGVACAGLKIPASANLAEHTPIYVPQINFPVKKMAFGAGSAYALSCDGVLYAWGDNSAGQLGTGSITSTCTPTAISCCMVDIAAGIGHLVALSCCNIVYAVGCNANGQLGDGSLTNRCVLTPTLSCLKAFCIGAGPSNSFMVGECGLARMWGQGSFGNLGNNDCSLSINVCCPLPICCDLRFVPGASSESLMVDVTPGLQYRIHVSAPVGFLLGGAAPSTLMIEGRCISSKFAYGVRIEYMF